jgi:hypothetical protein
MVWTPVCTATYGKNYGVGRQHVEQPSTADSISFHERVVATSDHWQAHHFDDGVIDWCAFASNRRQVHRCEYRVPVE